MTTFIFDFKSHEHFIPSFLEAASLAHGEPKKTKEWFNWKFKENPQGEAILACAHDGDTITGCVAYGIQLFRNQEESYKGALSFETFVHPEYQRQGIFTKLIEFAEIELYRQNVDVLLNFPNANSLKGFLNKNWNVYESIEYWLKVKSWIRVLAKIKHIRQPFIPKASNLKDISLPDDYRNTAQTSFESEVSSEYLKWRFFSFPNAHYCIVYTQDYFSLGRLGHRGALRELQILVIQSKTKKDVILKNVIKHYGNSYNFDLISIPLSSNHRLRGQLLKNIFMKVPNHTNSCYKILSDKLNHDQIESLELTAVNFHTY